MRRRLTPLFVLALLLVACRRAAPAGPATGQELFRRELCGSCHGSAGKGTWMGPPLRGLGAHWTREELADFLRDPAAKVRTDPRLEELSRRFPNAMKANQVLGKQERTRLADWLLSL